MDSTWFLVIAIIAISLQGLMLLLALFEPGLEYKIKARKKAPLGSPEFVCVLEALTDAKIHTHTRLRVLTNGDQFYEDELETIAKATQSVHLEAYLFERGELTQRFLDVLTERARAGVEVRLVLDAIGSFGTWDSYFNRLREAGGKVAWYHGFKIHLLPRLNNRTHRELLIVDGRVAYIGGAGFADHWYRGKKKHPRWRDTMVRVEGDAVVSLQATFTENWLEAAGEVLVGNEYYPAAGEEKNEQDCSAVLVINSSPSTGRSSRARILFQTLLASAEKSIYVNSPYFLPDASARKEFVRASNRGVDVKIIVPGHKSDHLLTRRSSRRLYGELLESGCRIFEYEPAMIHHKALIVDGHWAVVGSTNFDTRSFGINDEVNLAARSEPFAERLTRDFEQDLKHCHEVTLEAWKRRGVFERVHEFFGWVLERQQ